MKEPARNRRRFLGLSAAAALASCRRKEVPSEIGGDLRPYGERAPFEKTMRAVREATKSAGAGSSRTPLQDLYGTITPSSLHFERHHAGVPQIDPAKHELLIHGLVEQPLVFTMADFRRLPSVSVPYFLECAGNTGGDLRGDPAPTVQSGHGLLSCSEWTGVPLSAVLDLVRVKPAAKWMIAEGADSARMARSIPIEKALDDALLAYGQNGEALRPEQGYPLRLILPGWEGNVNIKWLHRLHLAEQPAMSVKETAYYSDLRPDGKAEIFSFAMEPRSVITRPSGGQVLDRGSGFYEVSGLAWSGLGKVAKVEVSTNKGETWLEAELQNPVLPKALTRFRLPWRWDGGEASLQSRCTDETGLVQPTRDDWVAVRGVNSPYHFNAVKTWFVHANGKVSHV